MLEFVGENNVIYRVERNSKSFFEIKATSGELPKDLDGLFTTSKRAEMALLEYSLKVKPTRKTKEA